MRVKQANDLGRTLGMNACFNAATEMAARKGHTMGAGSILTEMSR